MQSRHDDYGSRRELFKLLLLIGWSGLVMIGCDSRHHAGSSATTPTPGAFAAATATAHTNTPLPKNLSVFETYSGFIPCADCAGIRIRLELLGKRSVGFYRLQESYVGSADGDRVVDSVGKVLTVSGYEANPSATVLQLNPDDPPSSRYLLRVDATHLRLLSQMKQEIDSRFNYTLTLEPVVEPATPPSS